MKMKALLRTNSRFSTNPAGRRTRVSAAISIIGFGLFRPKWRRGGDAGRGMSPNSPSAFPVPVAAEEVQKKLDDGISHLREVARILAVLHGTPDLGNKQEPTDELVYIILARLTGEGAYQQAFDLLKKRFRFTWRFCWQHLATTCATALFCGV
jgi:hypothetical protein